MKQNDLISYTYDFISQLIENKIIVEDVKKIILFGSVVRGDFREDSDIDLFFDASRSSEKIKDLIKKEISKFEERIKKTWVLRGIDLPIKVVVGDLEQEKWKELKQEILNYGKILYGNYKEIPEKIEHKILITYILNKVQQKKKMALLRNLYGYVIKKGNKKYIQKGLVERIEGEKINSNTLMINVVDLSEVKKIFKKFNIKYNLRDIWIKE